MKRLHESNACAARKRSLVVLLTSTCNEKAGDHSSGRYARALNRLIGDCAGVQRGHALTRTSSWLYQQDMAQ